MFKYIPNITNSMINEKISANEYSTLYPKVDLPKWMITQENAVISFDDI